MWQEQETRKIVIKITDENKDENKNTKTRLLPKKQSEVKMD